MLIFKSYIYIYIFLCFLKNGICSDDSNDHAPEFITYIIHPFIQFFFVFISSEKYKQLQQIGLYLVISIEMFHWNVLFLASSSFYSFFVSKNKNIFQCTALANVRVFHFHNRLVMISQNSWRKKKSNKICFFSLILSMVLLMDKRLMTSKQT